MISPNGIAHIQLTVRDVAASRPFYYKLLHETFGMAIQYDIAGQVFYCIGARTGVLIRNAAPEHAVTPFDQSCSVSPLFATQGVLRLANARSIHRHIGPCFAWVRLSARAWF